jgi:hypothetical protein
MLCAVCGRIAQLAKRYAYMLKVWTVLLINFSWLWFLEDYGRYCAAILRSNIA